MEFYERAAAIQRAGIFVNAAIREENRTRKCAATWRDKAIRGSLHDMATFIRLADRFDDAVIRRIALENYEAAL